MVKSYGEYRKNRAGKWALELKVKIGGQFEMIVAWTGLTGIRVMRSK